MRTDMMIVNTQNTATRLGNNTQAKSGFFLRVLENWRMILMICDARARDMTYLRDAFCNKKTHKKIKLVCRKNADIYTFQFNWSSCAWGSWWLVWLDWSPGALLVAKVFKHMKGVGKIQLCGIFSKVKITRQPQIFHPHAQAPSHLMVKDWL